MPKTQPDMQPPKPPPTPRTVLGSNDPIHDLADRLAALSIYELREIQNHLDKYHGVNLGFKIRFTGE